MTRPGEVHTTILDPEQQSGEPIVSTSQLRQYLDFAARSEEPSAILQHLVSHLQLDMLGVMLCERLTSRERNREGLSPKDYTDSVYLLIEECRAGIDTMSDRPLPPEILGVPISELPLEILGITDGDMPDDLLDLAEEVLPPEILGLQTESQYQAITRELLVGLPHRAFGSEFADQIGIFAAQAYYFALEPNEKSL